MFEKPHNEPSGDSLKKPRILMPEEIKKMTDKRARASAAIELLMKDFELSDEEIESALNAAREKSSTDIWH